MEIVRLVLARAGWAAGATFGLVAVPAFAGYTQIDDATRQSLSHQQIVVGLYGGTFQHTGVDFVGTGLADGIKISRVNDFGFDGVLALATDTAASPRDDEIWQDGVVTSTLRARYASGAQELGFITGDGAGAGGTYTALVSTGAAGFIDPNTPGASSAPRTLSSDFRWARTGPGGTVTSLSRDNSDRLDHMVAYEVTDSTGRLNGGNKTWLLFWDTAAPGAAFGSTGRDFNDLVVEVVLVPLPPAGVWGAAALGMLGAGMIIRRRRLSSNI